ncbi:UDP-N-acetylmuramoyl-tripeptide--D-alanyl-D-alanine ligase [Rhodobacteraceae bacterium 63075]|nr:UDP-N-acetylmuramoyl-tripeptide--D-alanyl-D-alanine ligase [Rhodobacteraceae bacterium 63075]
MSALWTAADVAKVTGGEAGSDWEAFGVSIDTRTLQKGDLFVALRAARDGHDFVAEALSKGAAAALVSRVPGDVENAEKLIVVRDVQEALEALGEAARSRSRAKVIAVTGSAGKTSTKEMLRTIFGAQGQCHAAEASYNNHWGVPLTLARMPCEADFAVIEIGMNHPGEIAPLSKLTRPHVALVTTVAPAHLAAFESIEGIAEEKASIFEGLEPGGTAIWNADVATAGILRNRASQGAAMSLSFGEKSKDYRFLNANIHEGMTVAQAELRGAAIVFKVGAAGAHFAMNGLAAIAASEAAGVDPALAATSLASWVPPDGRGSREVLRLDEVEDDHIELIDDAFNANPASMAASLDVLAALPRRGDGPARKIAIIGDMLELGETEAQKHADLADLQSIAELDRIHCIGPLSRHTWTALPAQQQGEWFETADEMAGQIRRFLRPGDIVLVKGSKGIAVSRIVTAIREVMRPKGERREVE